MVVKPPRNRLLPCQLMATAPRAPTRILFLRLTRLLCTCRTCCRTLAVAVQCGPRFELKLYQIKLGTMDQAHAENEWVLRAYTRNTKVRAVGRKYFLVQHPPFACVDVLVMLAHHALAMSAR